MVKEKIDLRLKNYKTKKEIIDYPTILTLNTLIGKATFSPDSYWIKIPRRLANNLGIKKRSSKASNIIVILKRPSQNRGSE